MSQRSRDPSIPEAEALREQVIKWRRTRRRHREPMPEALWSEALELAQIHGVSPVARAVGIDYSGLKRRLERFGGAPKAVNRGGRTRPQVPAVAHDFIEVETASFLNGASGALVELERPDGCRVRVSLPAGSHPDWVALATSLFGGGPC